MSASPLYVDQAPGTTAPVSSDILDSRFVTKAVPEISPPPRSEFFARYVQTGTPALLKGLGREWPVVKSWTPDELRRRFGGHVVPVARTKVGGALIADPRFGVIRDLEPFGRFIDRMLAPAPTGYMTGRSDELPPSMANELPVPGYCRGEAFVSSKVWVSPAGGAAALHRDLPHNIHLQVYGSKRFILVAPSDGAGVYPSGPLFGIPMLPRIDLRHPDFVRFPRLRDVTLHVADLEPGDAIYIPRLWWHEVRTLQASISANWFFSSGVWAGLVYSADVAKRVMGLSR
jgi:hypothetical protein